MQVKKWRKRKWKDSTNKFMMAFGEEWDKMENQLIWISLLVKF